MVIGRYRLLRKIGEGGMRELWLAEQKEPGAEVVAIDNALNRLAELDPRMSQIVELRYFAGLGVDEICEALKISPESVTRDWRAAKAWLYGRLTEGTEIGT